MPDIMSRRLLTATLFFCVTCAAVADNRIASNGNGQVVLEKQSCPAAGCRVVCTSYETGQVLLDRKFRRLTVMRYSNSDLRLQASSSFGNVDIFLNSQGAFCDISD